MPYHRVEERGPAHICRQISLFIEWKDEVEGCPSEGNPVCGRSQLQVVCLRLAESRTGLLAMVRYRGSYCVACLRPASSSDRRPASGLKPFSFNSRFQSSATALAPRPQRQQRGRKGMSLHINIASTGARLYPDPISLASYVSSYHQR